MVISPVHVNVKLKICYSPASRRRDQSSATEMARLSIKGATSRPRNLLRFVFPGCATSVSRLAGRKEL